jgi:hypothetical protein
MGSKVIAVLGGTGTGKSKLAIELAKTYNGEVVNCDSMQVCFPSMTSILVPVRSRIPFFWSQAVSAIFKAGYIRVALLRLLPPKAPGTSQQLLLYELCRKVAYTSHVCVHS